MTCVASSTRHVGGVAQALRGGWPTRHKHARVGNVTAGSRRRHSKCGTHLVKSVLTAPAAHRPW